jgi:hypothetical protein
MSMRLRAYDGDIGMSQMSSQLWWSVAFNCFRASVLWAFVEALRKLHSLGQDVWGIVCDGLLFGVLYAFAKFVSAKMRST